MYRHYDYDYCYDGDCGEVLFLGRASWKDIASPFTVAVVSAPPMCSRYECSARCVQTGWENTLIFTITKMNDKTLVLSTRRRVRKSAFALTRARTRTHRVNRSEDHHSHESKPMGLSIRRVQEGERKKWTFAVSSYKIMKCSLRPSTEATKQILLRHKHFDFIKGAPADLPRPAPLGTAFRGTLWIFPPSAIRLSVIL